MSSSDSDAPRKPVRARPVKAKASSDSDSDSDNDNRKRAVRGGRGAGRAQAKKGSDSDDSDSDGPSAPTRRPAQRKPAKGGDSDTDTTDDDTAGDARAGGPRKVQLWLPINYDDMSQEAFYELLKEKSRQSRQEEKRMAEQQADKTEAEEPIEAFIDDSNVAADGVRGYKYSEMLQRIYTELRLKNPELGDGSNKRVKLPVPKTEKASTKTTALSNFKEMCKAMNREMDHVKDFIEKELTTSTSIDVNNCLIMKVRNVKAMQIEGVFQKYVEEYCQCGNCGSINTLLEKNPVNRLWVLKCQSCKASRTVQAAANATYKAQIGRRKHL